MLNLRHLLIVILAYLAYWFWREARAAERGE